VVGGPAVYQPCAIVVLARSFFDPKESKIRPKIPIWKHGPPNGLNGQNWGGGGNKTVVSRSPAEIIKVPPPDARRYIFDQEENVTIPI